jgi:hypothetical protein
MLDLSDERNLIDSFWESTKFKATLPEPEKDYFAPQGPMPVSSDSRRVYHRFYLRGKAILNRHGSRIGVFTKDVSRQGIGFLSPVQLLPKERVQMRLPGATELKLVVTRCRRIDQGCFDAGAKFELSS